MGKVSSQSILSSVHYLSLLEGQTRLANKLVPSMYTDMSVAFYLPLTPGVSVYEVYKGCLLHQHVAILTEMSV